MAALYVVDDRGDNLLRYFFLNATFRHDGGRSPHGVGIDVLHQGVHYLLPNGTLLPP